MTTSDATRIAERYGVARRRPSILLILLLVAAVVMVAWFGWAVWMALTPKVSSGLETWKALSENEVEVTYVVRIHDAGTVPTCSVEAEDANEQTLGSQTFRATEGRHTITFPTERRALRVVWNKCTAPGQDDPN